MAFTAMFQATAAPKHVGAAKEALATLARESAQQAGTLRYEFYQYMDDPTRFLLFAIWENEAAWQGNLASDAHIRYVESLPEGTWTVPPTMTRLQTVDDSE